MEEISDYSFTFEHVSGKNMFVSDFLSRFSDNNDDGEAIPFVTDTSILNNKNFMAVLNNKCKFDYSSNSGVCTGHCFPVTRSQTKSQKIQMPSLFSNLPVKTKRVTVHMVAKVPISKIASGSGSREIAKLPPTTTHTSQPPGIQQVCRHGRPCKIRDDVDTNMDRSNAETQHPTVEELNANLPILFTPMHRRNQQKHVTPIKEPKVLMNILMSRAQPLQLFIG